MQLRAALTTDFADSFLGHIAMTKSNNITIPPLLNLPERLPRDTHLLASGVSASQLIDAAAENHAAHFAATARAEGGAAHETNGVAWVASPTGFTIMFPSLAAENASETLDAIMAEQFGKGLHGGSCWALTPTQPADLGARIAARGFEWGWRPHWMALNLDARMVDCALPDGLQIAVDDIADWETEDLPYYNRGCAPQVRAALCEAPRRAWHFGAWREGKIVGHSILRLTTGDLGVGGLYSVGVAPAARGLGVGKAISLAACQYAKALGAHYVLVNSAADKLYESIGFESLGWGQSWWIHEPVLAGSGPTRAEIAFAEAVGRGDLDTLNSLAPSAIPANLDAPGPNGTAPMALAVRASQQRAAEWLASRGATLDILDAYDLGGEEFARRRLAEQPDLVNRRTGDWQITPLHEAVSRGNSKLARLILSGNPDLSACDSEYESTALGWAKHMGRPKLAALIEAHMAARPEA